MSGAATATVGLDALSLAGLDANALAAYQTAATSVPSTTVVTDATTVASLLNANGRTANGSWEYNPVTNSWNFNLVGNFANSTSGSRAAAGGWFLINTTTGGKGWYKFDANGNMLTGMQKETTGTYYLDMNPGSATYGALSTGWANIGGAYYYFDATGRLLANGITPDGWMVDANGMRGQYVGQINAMAGTAGMSLPASPKLW